MVVYCELETERKEATVAKSSYNCSICLEVLRNLSQGLCQYYVRASHGSNLTTAEKIQKY